MKFLGSALNNHNFANHRHYPISQYYRNKLGEKIYKVSVSVAETCPNRSNKPSNQMAFDDTSCIFCDEWGSAAYHLERDKDLQEQIQVNKLRIQKRYKANKFLVYFQSYTNTFDRTITLKERFHTALAQDDIVGLVLGTRPDCLPARLLEVLKELNKKTFLQVEIGVQTFDNSQLKFLRRGHSAECSIDAIKKLHEQTGVDIGIHLMFGLPDETDQQLIATAQRINQLPISNVKLHNLHVLTNTALEQMYHNGSFIPIELDEYCRRVILFLRHLSPDIAIQRLTAVANRWDELVAPQWTKEKRRPAQYIEDEMARLDVYQGDSISL